VVLQERMNKDYFPCYCCRGRLRTSTEQLAIESDLSAMSRRIRRTVYPVIPTPETGGLVCQFQHPTMCFVFQISAELLSLLCCRGRLRTFTERLAIESDLSASGRRIRLRVSPEFSTPETGGLVCQFQHPTMCSRISKKAWIVYPCFAVEGGLEPPRSS
jgi:hypothetical protein